MLSVWRKRRRNGQSSAKKVILRGRRLAIESLESRQVLSTTNLGLIQGSVFIDNNADNSETVGEELSGVEVRLYRDLNNSGAFENSDQFVTSTTTNAAGDYSFSGLAADNYLVVQNQQNVNGNALVAKSSSVISIASGGVQGTIIDTFNVPSGPTIDPNTPGFTEVNHGGVDAIGGERDFLVELTSGANPQDTVQIFSGNGVLQVDPTIDAIGRYQVTWDGVDQANLGVNHTGLGGVDLTEVNGESGRSTGICLHDVFVDQPGAEIRFRVYTAFGQFSEAIIRNVPTFSPQDIFIPFSGNLNGIEFTNSGLPGQNGPADFTNVGAIRLEIIATQQAMDGRLALINAIAPVRAIANILNEAPVPNIQIEKFTNGVDADVAGAADVPVIAPGATVTWTYEVTNTGDAALTTVTLTDDREGAVTTITNRAGGNQDNVLDPNETWTYQKTGTALAGAYENKVTVTGATGAGVQVMDMDLSHYLGAAPQIDIEKSTNGFDADLAGGNDVPNVDVGSQVTWSYRVENTGTLDLVNVVVTDDVVGPIANIVSQSINADNILQPTEVWVYQQTGVARSGPYENRGTVNASTTRGTSVTDVDSSHYVGTISQIDIEKFTNGNQADNSTDADVPDVFVNQSVTFTYVVSNVGTIPVTNVVVIDDNGTPGNPVDDFSPTFQGGDIDNDLALDVTETWNYSATRNATLGLYTNVAAVTGRDPNQRVVEDSDPSNHVGIAPPPLFGKRAFLASSFP